MKTLGIIIALAVLAAVIFGWAWVVAFAYNSVALALGWKLLGYWTVFWALFLLGVVGQAFRSPEGKNT